MTITIISLFLLAGVFYLATRNKEKKTTNGKKNHNPDISNELNSILKEYCEVANDVKKLVMESAGMNNFSFAQIEKAAIAQELKIAFKSGKFSRLVESYLDENFDSIEYISQSVINLGGITSQLSPMQLQLLNLKIPYIESDLQREIVQNLETNLILESQDIQETKAFILRLILKTKNQLTKYYFDAK
ncbi:hypothetical protein FLLO111716_08270 [Flavobacterium longum]|uniref:hypothetical protein n=1 Tax=Flavobacterium longum TaxID=1299340 RepID=UPI0039ED5FDD